MEVTKDIEVVYKASFDEEEKKLLIMSLGRMVSNYVVGSHQHDTALRIKKQLEELK